MAEIEDSIGEWVTISEYDLKTAKAMLIADRYLYVAFMSQQAIEKLLKAIYVQNVKELPPRTHNLLYLVHKLALNISEEHKKVFSQLNQYYIESRYPGERVRLAQEMNKAQAEGIYNSTKEAWECLKKQLALKK